MSYENKFIISTEIYIDSVATSARHTLTDIGTIGFPQNDQYTLHQVNLACRFTTTTVQAIRSGQLTFQLLDKNLNSFATPKTEISVISGLASISTSPITYTITNNNTVCLNAKNVGGVYLEYLDFEGISTQTLDRYRFILSLEISKTKI